MSPSAYARAVGIDRSTLSQLLSPANERLPRAETLAAIATLAGVSVDWLLGLQSEERPGAEGDDNNGARTRNTWHNLRGPQTAVRGGTEDDMSR